MVTVGKSFLARECRHFSEDFGLDTRVARYHNCMVQKEHMVAEGKGSAALCRKIIEAKLSNKIQLMLGRW